MDNTDLIPLRSVPDLRGTPTDDATGVPAGQLWGALAEAHTGLLRYLDLQLHDIPRHVLVPIGHARLTQREGVASVRLRAALLEDLAAIPAYEAESEAIEDPYERALLEAHGRAYHGERYYAHPSFDHTGLYAGDHPIVVSGHTAPVHLQPLCELDDYRVADDEADIRGWRVCGGGDATLGVVQDLIVDVQEEKVRYVALEEPGSDRRVLLPVGFLVLDASAHEVHAGSLYNDDLGALPAWSGGPVDRSDEEAVRAALTDQLRGRRRYELPDYRYRE